jgi:hypothetical protein
MNAMFMNLCSFPESLDLAHEEDDAGIFAMASTVLKKDGSYMAAWHLIPPFAKTEEWAPIVIASLRKAWAARISPDELIWFRSHLLRCRDLLRSNPPIRPRDPLPPAPPMRSAHRH